jgi:hypothetical protein
LKEFQTGKDRIDRDDFLTAIEDLDTNLTDEVIDSFFEAMLDDPKKSTYVHLTDIETVFKNYTLSLIRADGPNSLEAVSQAILNAFNIDLSFI